MFSRFRIVWEEFKSSPPGSRFQDVRKKRAEISEGSGALQRWLWVGAGLLLIAVGVVFMAIPGPGTAVLLVGVALIARESMVMARFLDRAELALRPAFLRLRRWWRGLSVTRRRIIMIAASGLGLAATAAFYYSMRH